MLHLINFFQGILRFNSSEAKSSGANILLLRPSAFSVKEFEIVISNIEVLTEIRTAVLKAGSAGFSVSAGWQLGTPKSRSGCLDFVHVAMRRISKPTDYSQDPYAYIAKAPLSLPAWKSQADQWYIKLLGATIKQGTFGALFKKISDGKGRTKKADPAKPPKKRRSSDMPLQISRRDVCSEFADVPDLCLSAGLPPFTRSVTFLKREYYLMVGGVILITLGFEIGGEFSVTLTLNFCLLTLKVTVTPTPRAVAKFDVYAGLGSCFVLCGGLKITGKVADISFPLPIIVG